MTVPRAIITCALIASACGRVNFELHRDSDSDGGGSDAALTCTAADFGSCDDGDPCTIDDVCVDGLCGPGRFDATGPGCSARSRAIFRSVGAGAAVPIATSAVGTLTITGTTAAFAVALPDRAGVGDVIQYDTNGNGSMDALAFISRRISSRVFEVHDAAGADPAPMTDGANWDLVRSYTTLANAVSGTMESPLVDASLRDFDAWTDGTDLVGNNLTWTIAAYADAVDSSYVTVCNATETRAVTNCTLADGWTTGPTNYLRIFTPTLPNEVGVSQRHRGRWGEGYQRTNGLEVYAGYVRVEGLSQRIDVTFPSRNILVLTTGLVGEVWVTHTFTWMANAAGYSRNFDVYDDGLTGAGTTRVVFANDIGISDSTADPESVFYPNSLGARVEIYNSTASIVAGRAFQANQADVVSCWNCLAHTRGTAVGFGGNNRFRMIRSSVSTDASVVSAASGSLDGDSSTAYGSRAVTFVDAVGNDFHLAPSDTGARGSGVNLGGNAMYTFGGDIDGETRPATWDVGADQTP